MAEYLEDNDSYSTLVFCISNPKSIFGEIWSEKVKAISFVWRLTHIHTQSISRMLILTLRLVFRNSKLISFFGQIWVEKVEFFTLPGSWYTKYLEDVIVRIQRKVWKQIKKWIIVLSACCSYIFIVAKSKHWRNQQNNVG